MKNPAFGRFLISVKERDVDLLLMEEFHASPDFVLWFCARIGLEDVTPVGAWHSTGNGDGETDLLLCVLHVGRRVGILIENKIVAVEQPSQAERYHRRGRWYCDRGWLEDYRTVICAPQSYLDGLPPERPYQHRVPYEAIAGRLGAQGGRRAEWRQRVMREAIGQGRRDYVQVEDAEVTAFHLDYWNHLTRRHPTLTMAKPKIRSSSSNWIIFKAVDLPKAMQLHHRLAYSTVELALKDRRVEDVVAALQPLPPDVVPRQRGSYACLTIAVSPVDIRKAFSPQAEAVEAALTTAYRLLPFAHALAAPEALAG